MAIVVSGISLPLDCGDEHIRAEAANKIGVREADIAQLSVKRQSLDSRKHDIRYVYTVHVTLFDAERQRALEEKLGSAETYAPPDIRYGDEDLGKPVIIGAGPCGLFAALTLAKHGYRPLLIERGHDIAGREKDVAALMEHGRLDEQSNVCFGAGGAGAFSDGKLTTRIKDSRVEAVLDTLIENGAPQEIRYMAKPHMGTENIRSAVSGIIGQIRVLGGEVCFESRLNKIAVTNGRLCGITYMKNGMPETVDTRAAVLATGHSARDTYEMLLDRGVTLVPKPFAVGLRIEHRRELIDRAQYGEAFGHPRLGAAEYAMTYNHEGRGVYTFCMCPGGEVICSATEAGGVAVNGMSYYARDAENSNSAIVVGVGTADFEPGPLGGVAFARRWERAAYHDGFGAPVQTLGDFAEGRVTRRFTEVRPSYRPQPVCADLRECLPGFVCDAILYGVRDFGRKLKGFDMPAAVLTGVETRTSSPVRILRGENLQAEGIIGLFPAGEGAGYAGGIVSAAVDGIKCAEALMTRFARP